jgi:ribosome-associated heat shock protein Hsp15
MNSNPQTRSVSVEKDSVRVDKWLWMVRVFKTRELAAEACRAGRVQVAGREVKPAHTLHAGHMVEVRQGILTRRLVVLAVPRARQGAARLAEYLRDETPPEDYARAAEVRRQAGESAAVGRPDDKKERRALRALWDDV